MATRTVSSFGTLYKGYIARLKALGCVFCRGCYCYVTPEHRCTQASVVTLRKAA